MKKLELSIIRLDGDTQVRDKLDQGTVKGYADLITDGVEFPPVTVYYDGSDYWLSSGFHRYFAHKKAKRSEIEAEIVNGTLEEAKLHAIEANNKNGKPLTSAERRGNIIRLLNIDISKDWSNAEIARHAGVSTMTVGRVRASIGEKKTEVSYTKGGKEQVMDTSKIGKKRAGTQPVDKPKKTPKPTNIPVDQPDERVIELVDTVNTLEEENAKLKDVIAIGQWDASEIEKLDIEQTVAELRERIRVLEIDNQALRESRDLYQARYNEAVKTVKSLQSKLKKVS